MHLIPRLIFLEYHLLKISGLLCFAIAVVVLVISGCENNRQKQPNVILIQFDDLGYNDLGIHGNSNIETPHIDAFANQSARLTRFYVNPVCAPTRAALLTGRHYLRTGVSHVHGGRDFVSLDETMIGNMFQSAGYRTGMWGKWHSGHTEGYFPWDRGFDEAYMAQLYKHKNSRGRLNGKLVEHEKWAEEVIVDYAMDFAIQEPDTPFFAYLSFLTCHRPLVAPEHLINKYTEKDIPVELATLYAMVDHADSALGEFFNFLEKKNLMDNSLVMIMSDNGPDYDAFTDQDIRDLRKVNHLRGYKGDVWENGVISPLFIRYGNNIQPGELHYLTDVTDILPTLLDICNISLPEDNLSLDGQSFKNVLINKGTSENNKAIVNYSHRGWPPANKHEIFLDDQYKPLSKDEIASLQLDDQVISYRKGNYKLLLNANNPVDSVSGFLFNLKTDPQEELNLFYRKAEVANELQQDLEQWWEELKTEENAFGSPVFFIGRDSVSTIPAKAPMERSVAVRSNYRYSFFNAEGQQAIYHINIVDAGDYSVEIEHNASPDMQGIMELQVNNQQLEIPLHNGSESNNVIHFQKGKIPFTLKIKEIINNSNEPLGIESVIFKKL